MKVVLVVCIFTTFVMQYVTNSDRALLINVVYCAVDNEFNIRNYKNLPQSLVIMVAANVTLTLFIDSLWR